MKLLRNRNTIWPFALIAIFLLPFFIQGLHPVLHNHSECIHQCCSVDHQGIKYENADEESLDCSIDDFQFLSFQTNNTIILDELNLNYKELHQKIIINFSGENHISLDRSRAPPSNG